MKLKAKQVSYSNDVVDGGLLLTSEAGSAAFMLAFLGINKQITKEQMDAMVQRVAQLINDHGLECPHD